MNHVEDTFIKHFTPTTYAAIPNRGTHSALKKLNSQILKHPEYKYCLKIDIKKYFPSIDKTILKQLIRKKFKDKDLLWLIDETIDGYPKSGIPIGNYTSQYFGNYYLSFFDHWIKEQKKIKVYMRYMDDMIFLAETKEELWILLDEIREYLEQNLKLTIKENYQVFPIESRGVDFVGYKSYGHKVTLRNTTKRRMIRITNKLKKKPWLNKRDSSIINSYKGIVSHVTGGSLYDNHIKELVSRLDEQNLNESEPII